MTETQSILLSISEDIARLELNRPQAGNAMDVPMIHALRDTAHAIAAAAPRAVVLSARGRQFCTGGDLRAFEELGPNISQRLRELTLVYHEAVTALTSLHAPLIAVVQGPAAGAGLSLICMCDFAFAVPRAVFSAAYTRVGLSPDGGLSYHLPRIVGLRRALDLVISNRFFSAQEACAMGILNDVVEDDKLEGHCLALAHKLRDGAPEALWRSRRLLRDSFESTLAEQLEKESLAFAASAGTDDAAEGRAAFLEKRAPVFKRS
ncbi:MAG: enoyl-CoA hydratase-related protein [Myxococcota bacterium]|jgi:2-(1,2-epoxy-1,2-dihydrophenyl)acetyl-CoA isomerase|nr:enoyl-CoA hydratase-related protein [Myxococcota bacterium]